MITVPDAFRQYRQFINWKEVDKGNKKPDKVPFDPTTGRTIDPVDPTNWKTAEEVLQFAEMGFGVGFVFTKEDPFFFLDIDNCLAPGNQWSEMATTLCETMQGSYVEISHSGEGLHIFGSGIYPEHSCRNTSSQLEFYTQERFVALTGTGANGDALFSPQPSIDWLITNYFNPGIANTQEVVEWTSAPCAEWHGIVNDTELIEKMLSSKSAGSAFGGKASLADLWVGKTEFHGGDSSAADAALCQHLAFWTGKDCDRIDRLFRQSSLIRDKWDERRGTYLYGQKTILNAVGRCSKVYGEKKQPEIGELREGLQYMPVDQQVDYFKGCTYVTDLHRVVTPKGQFLKPDQFKVVYGGWVFAMDNINGKSGSCAYGAFTQNQGYDFPKVDTTCFRPDLPESLIFEQNGLTVTNTWVKVNVDRAEGDVSPFLNHLEAILPIENDREILLSFMASVIQNPGEKIPWMPVIQGCQGNGKSMLIEVMINALSERYCHTVSAADLAKNGLSFNAWLRNKLFVAFEEIYVPKRREIIEALKPFITQRRIEIQGKGVDQVMADNCANFMACTNHKDGVPKQKGDRRHCILFTAQQNDYDMIKMGWKNENGNSTKYFANLYKWLNTGGYAVVTDYLFKYVVSDELNPFTTATTAPFTSSTGYAIECGMGGLEQDILEAIDEGRPGFVTPWVSSFALAKLIDDRRDSKTFPQNKRKEIMYNMGFVYHPSLKNGRVTTIIPNEGGKPRLFVLQKHLATQISRRLVIQEYIKTQAEGDSFAKNAFA